ncbi:hypothetical protein JJQ72_06550 [Paenibacillus sp. F411]|uniref:hypothetical protein n=1 Tax=Paenibacillus sp. F411 TaxID=2820239 RepID=UPI001AAE7FB9|nr:hypothetical protein [Paenibacillus sp. F411]MBO2943638.1 hypothetical protein [Paenibacillus sp. F411]
MDPLKANVQNPSETEVDIKERVTKYIQGKNGLIGIVIPPCDEPTSALDDLYKTIADIAIKQAKRKAAQND